MSILKKPYELSLWEDDANLQEFKALIIGSDQMTSPDRALDVKFTCDVNGTHQLTFKMYYQYYDTQTGELVHNLFADQIVNESKVKLHYDDQWYDFVIKNIVKNSNDYSFQYTAQDLYIQELSKTGYNIEFSDELENNMDTIYNLVSKVVEGTDWAVNDQSDVIVQTQKEILFTGTLNTTVTNGFKKLNRAANGAVTVASNFTTLSQGTRVYLFYSDLADQSKNYQILIPNGPISLDSDNVMLNTTQYRYYGSNTTQSFSSLYQLSFPSIINGLNVTTYQGEKYIFSQETKIDTKLKKVLSKYTDGEDIYWGFIETEYNSPAMIRNFVSNPNNFQSTVGWRAGATVSGSTASLELDSDPSLIQKLKNGEPIGSNTSYTPVLKVVTSDENTCLINTGIRDNLSSIKELCVGDQFVYYLKFKSNTGAETIPAFDIEIREILNYNNGVYTFDNVLYFIGNMGSFNSNEHKYGIGTVQKSLSYKDMKHKNLAIVLRPSSSTYFDFSIIDFQMFRYVPYYDEALGSLRPMLPTDTDVQGTITNHYCYFKDDPENPQEYTSIEDLEYESYVEPNSNYEPVMRPGCEKVRSINAKESNRFNIIQDLCETFECWASFDIEHNNIGRSLSKKITIHQYIGQDNPARFLNGVNLKTTSRTLDSNQLVTKLIVKPNSNQYADGGFCTIATATPNPSGETAILNFDYYINQQLLYPSTLVDDFYKYDNYHIGYYTRLKILNNDLIIINKQLSDLAVTIAQARAKVEKAKAGKEAAEEGEADVDATLERYWQINLNGIRALTPKAQPTDPDGLYEQLQSIVYSVEHDDPNAVQNKALLEQVTRGLEYQRNKNQFAVELADAESLLENYEQLETELKDAQEAKITEKKALDSAFFIKYHRFIQEGTWIDEKYVDDDLYFYDARSIGYESSMPKVTYQMNVIDVSVLPEYEGYTFKIGDRTYIQDPEFFGYTVIDNIKTPAKEEVTVNKIVYSLDNPSATQITIQTYKNLFQDLFQKITATVQQVHYATGQYEKAAALAEAETAQKVEFLQDALNDAATILSNSADQTVVWDNTGITITNSNNTSEKLRLVSGGILLGAPNAWGETEWKVGVTAKGVSANLLTSGQLNTGVVQIMAGTEPTFRWDALGLTAYDYVEDGGQITSTNTNQGVRFDRLGVYGFTGVDGSSWHPSEISAWKTTQDSTFGQINTADTEAVTSFSTFSLTKEGLYLKLGGLAYGQYHTPSIPSVTTEIWGTFNSPKDHAITAWLGKGENLIYNVWSTNNNVPAPYYMTEATWESYEAYWQRYYDPVSDPRENEFIKIFDVNNGKIQMYDNGKLYAEDAIIKGSVTATSGSFTGSITANNGSIGGFRISNNALYTSTSPHVGLSGTNTNMIFAGATSSDGTGAKFTVNKSGEVTATNMHISAIGNTTNPQNYYSNIGLWIVGNPFFNGVITGQGAGGKSSRYFYTCTNGPENVLTNPGRIMGFQDPSIGNIAFTVGATDMGSWNSGNFYVTHSGIMTAKGATINEATITNASINEGTIINASINQGSIENIIVRNLIGPTDVSDQGNEWVYFENWQVFHKSGNNYTVSCTYRSQGAQILTSEMTIRIRLYNNNTNPFITDIKFPIGLYTHDTPLTYRWNISADSPDYTNVYCLTESPQQASSEGVSSSAINIEGHILPTKSSTDSTTGYDLGSSDSLWRKAYIKNGVSNVSDRRLKQNISLLSSSYDSFFDALRPSTYQWLNESTTHTGFIAQEVADALAVAHLSPSDFYGYRDENPDSLGLAYSEFISLNTWQIQKLKKRVADLEARCSLLEQKLLNQN